MGLERVEVGFLCIAITLVLIAIRMPIGIALAGVSFVGIGFLTNMRAAWGIVSAIPYNFVATWEFSAVPMFLMMGYIAARSGVTKGLFQSMQILLARVPGSLASASVAASAMFAAASGSSVATSAALSRIAVPEMLRAGYEKGLATGTVAAAGTLGSLIPPSILMVIYGVFTGTSIGALFMAGFIPGVLTAVAFITMITIRVLLNPKLAPRGQVEFSAEERQTALRTVWPLPTLIIGVLGGIFAGVFTPTEAGAVGALFAIVIAAFYRSLSLKMLWGAVIDAAIATSVMFIIAVGAAMFVRLMGLSQVPAFVADMVLNMSDNKYVVLMMISVIFIFLGMFIDSIGIMLLTLPILMPLLQRLEIDMIWFGIITIKLLEIGLITPPVGLNVYVIKTSLGGMVDLPSIFRGASWFILTDIIVLLILIAFPTISLLLPSLMLR
ncbi:TRAP transporter large permease [Microvirga splendida]|uniref:TRAP transporter large permease protein n=1 Tax=Microvirga splendida TaxID=2795727 RepID=A0ABS0Y749_9HYPH|nr:TRAP transporter large permease [Microvirga splendida]MBJ6128129.1 TRAP transporter large permease [Microvirga splendida]